MKRRLISLRTAVIVPFILLITLMMALSLIFWTQNYNWLVHNQSEKILTSLNANTNQKLNALLTEPNRINAIFANAISDRDLYGQMDITEIQSLSAGFMRRTQPSLPQISVISYGDANGNFVGIRTNSGPGDYSLMLKDARTQGLLNIYETSESTSDILASFQDYDPRTRPWYVPVTVSHKATWSDIYVNQDEKQEITLSSMMPVFDKKGQLRGVADIDIRLDELSKFLSRNASKGNGAIYIVDEKWHIISDSYSASNIKSDSPDLELGLVAAVASANRLVSESSKHLIDHKADLDELLALRIGKESYFTMVSNLEQPSGLNWKIVSVIPETDIMGDLKKRENFMILISLVIGILAAIIGSYLLNRVIAPVLKTAEAAEIIGDGKWATTVKADRSIIRETALLVHGFNTMSLKISESFSALQAANLEIERLHEDEKRKLEALVLSRTEDLMHAMQELMDKEKLASLGSLVTGIAHEINTPLGVAVTSNSYLKMLLKELQEKSRSGTMTTAELNHHYEDMDECLTILDRNLDRSSELVRSFKQISVEQSTEEKVAFELHDYANNVLLSLKSVLRHRDLKIDFHCDRTLSIHSYPGAFSQIITNLVMNSITHAFDNEAKGEIAIHFDQQHDHLSFLYSDNGKGIAPEILPKVFDPFFTTNRSNGGTGLGLNIVYNLVTNQLNGKINCDSQLGEGTVFKMKIPL